jgi:hypothetical protein
VFGQFDSVSVIDSGSLPRAEDIPLMAGITTTRASCFSFGAQPSPLSIMACGDCRN